MRLQEDTPARLALEPRKKKRGRPQMTWLKVIEKDLNPSVELLDANHDSAGETIVKLESVTLDRKKWAAEVKNIMGRNL